MGRKKHITKGDLMWPKMKKLPPKAKKVLGERFGYLVVYGFAGIYKKPTNIFVECMCDCGNVILVNAGNLLSGNSKSCGCKMAQLVSENKKKHGYASSKGREKIYVTWRSIRDRCYNPNGHAWDRYGGRGIVMCNGWRNSHDGFLNFAHDLLPITDISLDRIDNDGNYSCGHCEECISNGWVANCRWASAKIQASNKSNNNYILINGNKETVSEASRLFGVNPSNISDRRKKGLSDEQIIIELSNAV